MVFLFVAGLCFAVSGYHVYSANFKYAGWVSTTAEVTNIVQERAYNRACGSSRHDKDDLVDVEYATLTFLTSDGAAVSHTEGPLCLGSHAVGDVRAFSYNPENLEEAGFGDGGSAGEWFSMMVYAMIGVVLLLIGIYRWRALKPSGSKVTK